jgi:hypothetical protein
VGMVRGTVNLNLTVPSDEARRCPPGEVL